MLEEVYEGSPIGVLSKALGGGLEPGQVGVIAARAGVGKSALLVHISLDALLRDRSVLHVALRSKISDTVALETPGVRELWEVQAWMEEFVEGVHSGAIAGSSGQRFTDIVNIGIGGSDLGPVMASRALRHYWQPGMNFHSVSNVDGTQLVDLTVPHLVGGARDRCAFADP